MSYDAKYNVNIYSIGLPKKKDSKRQLQQQNSTSTTFNFREVIIIKDKTVKYQYPNTICHWATAKHPKYPQIYQIVEAKVQQRSNYLLPNCY